MTYLINDNIVLLNNGLSTLSKVIFKGVNHTMEEFNHKQRRNWKGNYIISMHINSAH